MGTRTQSTAAGEYRSPGTTAGTRNQQEGIVEKVRERAAAQISTQKNRATDELGSMAQAVRQSSQQLRDQHHDAVAGFIEQAADQVERWSHRLKEKDVGELVEDAQRLARRQPALFVGSAFALGLLGARFFKSSPPHDEYGGYGASGYGSTDYSSRASSAGYTAGQRPGTGYGASQPSPGSGTSTPGTPSTTTRGYGSSETERY